MPPRRPSWVRRSVGLVLSRYLLRRSLALQGAAALATVISRPVTVADRAALSVVASAAAAQDLEG
jgi:hypothetical protein